MSEDAGTATPSKPRRKWRWPLRVGIALAVIIAMGIGGVAVAYPPVVAMNCPGCYGMADAGDDVFVNDDMSAAERREATGIATRAKRRVSDFYGGQVSDPRVLVCGTAECYQRIGGGRERGVAIMNTDLMLSPKGISVEIASHELSHVELASRLGDAAVPQWFDEGLAVTVSDDPRWLKPEGEGDRCTERPDAPLPETLDGWLREATADDKLYAKAACEVTTWIDANGGRSAVRGLVRDMSGGTDFDDAFQAVD